MKSVHFKSKSNEKFSTSAKKSNFQKKGKKTSKLCSEHFEADIIRRPDSCPASANWEPKRNWHKILSEAGDKTKYEGSPLAEPMSCGNECKSQDEEYKFKLDDELMNIVLPTVNFCYPQKDYDLSEEQGPNIVDLCDEEKRKIAQLVQEIAKCKKEKLEDEETIIKLKNEIAELRASLSTALEGKNYSESKTVSSLKSRHSNEQAALKNQVAELSRLVREMQAHKGASDARLAAVLTRAERLTRATHALHADNARLRAELRLAEDRIAARQPVGPLYSFVGSRDSDTSEATSHQFDIKAYPRPLTMEDKACQPSREIIVEKDFPAAEPKKDEQKEDSEDQFLLKELFFNKSMENEFLPKETIIFLMSGCNDQLPPFLKTTEKKNYDN